MPDLPQTLNLYRFHQVVYVISDSFDEAKRIVSENTLPLAEVTPGLNSVCEEDDQFAPLYIQEDYTSLFKESEQCISGHDETQLKNINRFIRFMETAFTDMSTFPVVDQLELTPPQLVRFFVTLAQRPSEVDDNTKAYYYLRFPTLEQRIKEWNLTRGFSEL